MDEYSSLSMNTKLDILRKMYLIRFFEQKTDELFAQKTMHGTTHLAIGQEAGCAGLSEALNKDDWVIATHRNHGYYLAKGASPKALMAEMMGLAGGSAKGLGGSMHLTDVQNAFMCSTSIVGASAPMAAGMAFAMKYKKQDNITAAIFGDGASNQGMVLEAFNLAAVWQCPVLFYCENNMYGMSTPAANIVAGEIYKRAEAFTIKSQRIDGNDVIEVYNAVKRAADYIRKTKKPYLIEAMTYRFCGHSKSDKCIYRTKQEEAAWLNKCPIKKYEEYLLQNGLCDNQYMQKIKKDTIRKIEDITIECKKDDTVLSLDKALTYTYPV